MKRLIELIYQMFAAGPATISIDQAAIVSDAAREEWEEMERRVLHLEATVEGLLARLQREG